MNITISDLEVSTSLDRKAMASLYGGRSNFSYVAFNPQPEPPKLHWKKISKIRGMRMRRYLRRR